jgi:hypothetical protein
VGLATMAAALMVRLKCKRGPVEEQDEEEDGAGDRAEDQPGDQALVPIRNCGTGCSRCPHHPIEVKFTYIP